MQLDTLPTPSPTQPVLDAALLYARVLTITTSKTHGVTVGRTWLRVYVDNGCGSRSVVCFVEATTGAVHSAKSWKQPGRATGRTVFEAVRNVTSEAA
jgi:hypothetical protein